MLDKKCLFQGLSLTVRGWWFKAIQEYAECNNYFSEYTIEALFSDLL